MRKLIMKREEFEPRLCKYRGFIFLRFDELVSVIGHPEDVSDESGGRANFRWRITIKKNKVMIYDWRQGSTSPFLMTKWHVAGEDSKAYPLLTKFLKEQGIDTRRNPGPVL